MLRLVPVSLFLCLGLLAGCMDADSTSSGASDPTANLSAPLFIRADRVTGLVGSTFSLDAVVPASSPAGAELQWDLGDGRTASGSSISITYPVEGLFEVSLELVAATLVSTKATQVLQVVSPQLDAPLFGIAPMPSLPGDVDGDQAITLLDVQRVGAVAGNLTPGSESILLSGDMNRDGTITDEDAFLLAQMVADATSFPSALSRHAGPRGCVVNILSPHLLDRSSIATIRFGSAPARTFFQPAPGHGTFLVPFDAVGRASLLPITPQQVEVELLINGVGVETHKFEVVNPPPATGREVDQLANAGTILVDAVAHFEASLAQRLAQFNASPEEVAALRAVTQHAFELLGTGLNSLRELRSAGSPAERAALAHMLRANGLDEVLLRVESLRARTNAAEGAGGLFETELEYLCNASKVQEVLNLFANTLSTSCSVASSGLLVAGLITGGATVPFAVAIRASCEAIDAANDIFEIVAGLLPSFDGKLILSATDAGPDQKEIRVRASLKENYLCTATGGIAAALISQLTEKMIKRIPIAGIAYEVLRRYPLESRTALRQALLEEIRANIERLLGQVFGNEAIKSLLDSMRQKVCEGLVGSGQSFLLDPARCDLRIAPAAAGSLSSFSAEAVLFTCATGFSGNVTILAQRNVCDEPAAGSVSFTCGGANVRICVGDNGSALDDIFEVVLNGESIIAPSVPVREACATRNLAPGNHTVQAIGRAAPDGIGTYFINFTPATVVSGPPLSGSNLTAGSVFTWTIRVGGQ